MGVLGKMNVSARISQGIDCTGQDIPLKKKTAGEMKTINIRAFTLFLKRKLRERPANEIDKI
jgi:hypothetical protein